MKTPKQTGPAYRMTVEAADFSGKNPYALSPVRTTLNLVCNGRHLPIGLGDEVEVRVVAKGAKG